jgi:putative alpha-1,2-mannosidase
LYVFSSLGFYPVNPAGGRYAIGSPAVKQAVIRLPAGKQFNIVVHNGSQQNIYIQSVRLNGKQYSHSYITNDDIVKGGVIEFEMGANPNFQWGVAPGDRPDDFITGR